ncbi:DUF1524 domain-containing protein [Pseudarthrobacter sp. NPDC058329]|uniref:GmrSD restriction endonuclease domain-containing protein n=1 Tax=Pseudarthrobacter sp. NPDC058329 TaxID=3346448 RepID=UPI0036D962FF
MFKILSWSASLVLTATAAVGLPQTASAADTASAASVLASLSVVEEATSGYDRTYFQHWTDADGDGCDTRSEVLQEESTAPVTMSSGCTVATGQWTSRYDGQTWVNASDVDIDHMVPLAEAWGSGAHAWSAEQRRDFANDMTLTVALEAVTDEVNQTKSDRDPAEWMPSMAGTACAYATDWVLVKYRWQLSIDAAEHAALTSTMSDACGAAAVTLPAVAITAPAPGPISFSDVDVRNQFHTEISWLAAQGISTGWVEPDGARTYRPLSPVNRDAMAAFLYRLAGKPEFSPPAVSPFADVNSSTQFYKEITWLAAKNISTGWLEPDGRKTFRPLEPVNRDAMAAFLYRYDNYPSFQAPTTSPFVDVSTGNQFYQQISWLASKGISTGFPIGSGCYVFDPVRPVARDAMAAFMYRFVNGGTAPINGGGCTPNQPPPPAPSPTPTPVPPPAPSRPANPGDTRNCTGSSGFSTWREAQSWFQYYYPHYGDVARLDGNGDGIACESLPGAP